MPMDWIRCIPRLCQQALTAILKPRHFLARGLGQLPPEPRPAEAQPKARSTPAGQSREPDQRSDAFLPVSEPQPQREAVPTPPGFGRTRLQPDPGLCQAGRGAGRDQMWSATRSRSVWVPGWPPGPREARRQGYAQLWKGGVTRPGFPKALRENWPEMG